MSAVMMLEHLGLGEPAARIREAYDAVLAEGDPALLTPDIGGRGGTREFTRAVVARLG